MDRLAALLVTAQETRRRIWASLPLWTRFAEVLYRLGATGSDAFGTAMYGLFVECGIEGMPDVKGVPAQQWVAKHGVNRLPQQYGAAFGSRAFRNMVGRYKNPAFVEDLMSNFYVDFKPDASRHLHPGWPLAKAENYVLRSLANTGLNMLKKKTELLDSSMSRVDEGEGPSFVDRAPAPPVDVEQAESRDVVKFLNKPEVRRRLQRIHPSAEQYLRLSLIDNYLDTEILGDAERGIPSMLDHPYNREGGPLKPQAWDKFKKLIYKALKLEYQQEMRL